MMNKLKYCLCLGCWLLAMPAEAALLKAAEFKLANGMTVAVIENHKAPLVQHMVWYKTGSVDEPQGKGGLAHLLEHLMFRGTQKVNDGEFNRILHENGAESNAFTTHDMTAYHQFADISKLEALMALEADRMRNLTLTPEVFNAEQKIVYEERQQRVENNPAGQFNERFMTLLHGRSPYGHPVTGLNEEIKSLTLDDVKNFYQKYYAPNNAVLVLSGDIDTPTAKKLAQKYYGDIPAQESERVEPLVENAVFRETLTMALPEIQTIKIVQKYKLPHHKKLGAAVYDFLVLAEYLGGGETAALYKDLVREQEKAVSVSADFAYATRGSSILSIAMLPASKSDYVAGVYERLLNQAIKRAMEKLTAEKLAKVKRKMLADMVYVNDNPKDAAYWVGMLLANDMSLADAQNYEQGIKNVSLESVRRAFRQLRQAPMVEGTLLPQSLMEKADE